jgi:hypothetical protein
VAHRGLKIQGKEKNETTHPQQHAVKAEEERFEEAAGLGEGEVVWSRRSVAWC